ncbi:endonuclease NucS [Bifidobacterium myosotis]|uniref:Endonuclease NucS n=1 Tax=Bifidobacterium myosotis TaxID=1630166 RepID=A0A5M9ZLJ2_9BIFI|nr:endonuclease NucS [Bifidobacterium myosotis]KAA8828481.1 endonuclease NucS [Bifidobacterium myosotis]
MRIIVADCSAEYSGRLNASLPLAKRVLLIKADSSLLIFSELGSYKPLNWMTAPCTIREITPEPGDATADVDSSAITEDAGIDIDTDTGSTPDGSVSAGSIPDDSVPEVIADIADAAADAVTDAAAPEKVLRVTADKSSDVLEVTLQRIYSDQTFDLGLDPGLVKDGVEDHLQRYLAEQIERIGKGAKLVRREYPTAIGPVDIMAINADGEHVAVEIKRHGGIDGVEQLTRYCELLNRDPLLAPVHGIFAAQTITPQAQVLAKDRGFTCLILDYDDMKGTEDDSLRLF